MANTLLTINMITREAVRLFMNSNDFIQNINKEYDDQFAQEGAKIGQTLRIRLPNDYTVRTGAAAQIQDTSETSTTLTVSTQQGVDVSFSSVDRAMSLDDYSRRILAPAINNLTGSVAATIMAGIETGACNINANVANDGSPISPTSTTWLGAGALLNVNSTPMGNRKIINDPWTEARTIASLSGLFNPGNKIGRQYSEARMQQALGFDWYMDQTVLKHTCGTFSAGTVDGADQTGTTLTVNAITGTLLAGDIIEIDGVNAVNRVTKVSTGQLRQFVVTSDVANGGTSIDIYPAIIPAASDGSQVQYQTVDVSPADDAVISFATGQVASGTYRKNFAYAPEAITMATADLEIPRGVHEAARERMDGISMRMVTAYDIKTDQMITRLDILFGFLFIRPEWVCIVPDMI